MGPRPPARPRTTLTGHTDGVTAVAWSPDGTRLATASDDGTVRLWDPTTGQTTTTLTGHTDAGARGGLVPRRHPPGHRQRRRHGAAVGPRPPARPPPPSPATPTRCAAVAWSPDGTRLATASDDNTVRVWDPATGHTTTLTGHTCGVRAMAFSPDGTYLATGGDDRTVILWDSEWREFTSVTVQSVPSLAWSGMTIATSQWGSPTLIDLRSAPVSADLDM